MRSSLHFLPILAAFALTIAPARAAPLARPTAVPAATRADAAPMRFKICRTVGMDAAYPGDTLRIPQGTEYDSAAPATVDPLAVASGQVHAIRLATTAPISLSPDDFCVIAPVKPLGHSTRAAVRASIDDMFEPEHNWQKFAATSPINLTYGFWQSNDD